MVITRNNAMVNITQPVFGTLRSVQFAALLPPPLFSTFTHYDLLHHFRLHHFLTIIVYDKNMILIGIIFFKHE